MNEKTRPDDEQQPGDAAGKAPRRGAEAAAGSPPADANADAGAAPEANLGFRQAMEELEGILGRIEGEEIDIDQLAHELRRAAQLLELCRGKIRKAEVEVTQIVQTLETPDRDESS